MRKIIVILLLAFAGQLQAQTFPANVGTAKTGNKVNGGMKVDSLFAVPNRDTSDWQYWSGITGRKITYFGGVFYGHTGSKWEAFAMGQGGGIQWSDTARNRYIPTYKYTDSTFVVDLAWDPANHSVRSKNRKGATIDTEWFTGLADSTAFKDSIAVVRALITGTPFTLEQSIINQGLTPFTADRTVHIGTANQLNFIEAGGIGLSGNDVSIASGGDSSVHVHVRADSLLLQKDDVTVLKIAGSQELHLPQLPYDTNGDTVLLTELNVIKKRALNVAAISGLQTALDAKATQQALEDTASAIRADFPSGGGADKADTSQIIQTGTETNTFLVAGVIKPTRSAGNNTWDWIDDADHGKINGGSISVDANKITVNFSRTGTQIYTLLVTPDESLIRQVATTTGTPYYGDGGYKFGSRVFMDRAEIYVSKPQQMQCIFVWDGANWAWGGGPINFNSPNLDVTWDGAGRLRIKTDDNFTIKSLGSTPSASNGTAANMLLPFIDYISSTWIDVYFWDLTGGAKLTTNPPTGFQFYLDFGVVDAYVNPQTEDFGLSSNFWLIGILKK